MSLGQAITGSNPNLITLKLFLSSLEYQKIYNFPQPGNSLVQKLQKTVYWLKEIIRKYYHVH